ncbi:nucleoside 2-deoxyribosyltransferase domain-containing protein [Oscillatoria sp. CS-180]|uniref:nucleoside 2-deoxyribosyltransferase domain-containing protein n=1 Tax=Oscillatoria sp. CS-180 TaxID=3021720 RepID=UPI00232FBD80|nr:nucleoside 2-deoxyribosyltransferase domain-containing protein [Oscillatoria sp. CS-180]MDB9527848.1 nucleoside 2-deoxyribosyltransferase domain-containing protein [Oscillatoria sp. CS-180]
MEGVFAALDRFFIDIIGTIIPGSILILGIWVILDQPNLFGSTQLFPIGDVSGWILLIAISYITGHAVSSIGKGLTSFIIEPSFQKLFKVCPTFSTYFSFIKSGKELREQIERRADFSGFVSKISRRFPSLSDFPESEKGFGFWRNLALSTSTDNSLVYRFVFISLLNLGIATDLILIALLWALLIALQKVGMVSSVQTMNWVIWIALLFMSLPFLERYYQFHRRSLQIPFSMAFIALSNEAEKEDRLAEIGKQTGTPAGKATVYLAGGFCSDWQDRVKLAVPEFEYIDPRQHNLTDPVEYTLWDLEGVAQSHIVFAYLENANPGGYALALELGYAKALSKVVIFIDEWASSEHEQAKYIDMLRAASMKVFSSLEEGIDFLEVLSKLYRR